MTDILRLNGLCGYRCLKPKKATPSEKFFIFVLPGCNVSSISPKISLTCKSASSASTSLSQSTRSHLRIRPLPSQVLLSFHLLFHAIYKIAEAAKDTFDIRKLRAGKPYVILAKKDSTEKAQVFIYQRNKVEYLIVDFTDSIQTKFCRKKVKTVIKSASGVIESSLSEAIEKQNLNYILALEMADIYAWTIDFFHLQKGDSFKLIYEEKDATFGTFIFKTKSKKFLKQISWQPRELAVFAGNRKTLCRPTVR